MKDQTKINLENSTACMDLDSSIFLDLVLFKEFDMITTHKIPHPLFNCSDTSVMNSENHQICLRASDSLPSPTYISSSVSRENQNSYVPFLNMFTRMYVYRYIQALSPYPQKAARDTALILHQNKLINGLL